MEVRLKRDLWFGDLYYPARNALSQKQVTYDIAFTKEEQLPSTLLVEHKGKWVSWKKIPKSLLKKRLKEAEPPAEEVEEDSDEEEGSEGPVDDSDDSDDSSDKSNTKEPTLNL